MVTPLLGEGRKVLLLVRNPDINRYYMLDEDGQLRLEYYLTEPINENGFTSEQIGEISHPFPADMYFQFAQGSNGDAVVYGMAKAMKVDVVERKPSSFVRFKTTGNHQGLVNKNYIVVINDRGGECDLRLINGDIKTITGNLDQALALLEPDNGR